MVFKWKCAKIGHAKITQTDAFNDMSYHFLWKRGIRPAQTEQFLVIVRVEGWVLVKNKVLLSRSLVNRGPPLLAREAVSDVPGRWGWHQSYSLVHSLYLFEMFTGSITYNS